MNSLLGMLGTGIHQHIGGQPYSVAQIQLQAGIDRLWKDRV